MGGRWRWEIVVRRVGSELRQQDRTKCRRVGGALLPLHPHKTPLNTQSTPAATASCPHRGGSGTRRTPRPPPSRRSRSRLFLQQLLLPPPPPLSPNPFLSLAVGGPALPRAAARNLRPLRAVPTRAVDAHIRARPTTRPFPARKRAAGAAVVPALIVRSGLPRACTARGRAQPGSSH